jgi:hypothetical protein
MRVRARIENGSLAGRDKIGVRVGKVVNKYKVGKHFALMIEETGFEFQRLEKQIAAEAALDGLYVIRTSVPKKQMTSAEAVRSYKALAEVERAFRSMKTIDLHIRPIHHRLEGRVRAHIFLCMLAYYVEWHMREAWREPMFADEDLERKKHRDPVAAAERSGGGARQSRHSKTCRRLTRPQLSHVARRSLHYHAQYLRGARRQEPRLDLPDDDDAESGTTSSVAIAAGDRRVATRSTPRNASTL